MTPLRLGPVVVAGVAAGILSFAGTWMIVQRGGTPLIVLPVLAIPLVVAALVLVVCGRAVRRLTQHEPTWIAPVQAPWVARAARAGALLGALVAGHMLAQAAIALVAWGSTFMAMQTLGAGITAASAVGLTIVGVIVERWCTIDDDEDVAAASVHPNLA